MRIEKCSKLIGRDNDKKDAEEGQKLLATHMKGKGGRRSERCSEEEEAGRTLGWEDWGDLGCMGWISQVSRNVTRESKSLWAGPRVAPSFTRLDAKFWDCT